MEAWLSKITLQFSKISHSEVMKWCVWPGCRASSSLCTSSLNFYTHQWMWSSDKHITTYSIHSAINIHWSVTFSCQKSNNTTPLKLSTQSTWTTILELWWHVLPMLAYDCTNHSTCAQFPKKKELVSWKHVTVKELEYAMSYSCILYCMGFKQFKSEVKHK